MPRTSGSRRSWSRPKEADPTSGHGGPIPIIQEGLDQGVEPRLLLRAARFFQAYEKMFWDAMMEAARGKSER